MINHSTIDKLIEMRLTAMSDAFRNQLNDPKMKEVPFEDRFGMMVDIEYNSRKNNRLKRLIKGAEFDQPGASIMDIDYSSGRRINKTLISRLATCEYIIDHRNIFYHRCYRRRQNIHGLRIWHGGLQAVLLR